MCCVIALLLVLTCDPSDPASQTLILATSDTRPVLTFMISEGHSHQFVTVHTALVNFRATLVHRTFLAAVRRQTGHLQTADILQWFREVDGNSV